MKIKLIIILILATVVSCKKSECKIEEVKTIFTEVYNDKKKNVYCHSVLIKDFDRECLDSVKIIELAKKYIDTVKYEKPIDILKLYFSDEDFIPNEKSQIMDDINKSCLVTIGYDLKTNKPIDFIFYNDDGKIIYWGDKWEPNGVEGDNWPIH